MAFIAAMVKAYERRGMDPRQALEKAQITPSMLRKPGARVTALQMEWMSEAAMRELDDEALGWFRRRLPWGSYGLLVRASLTAPTLGVAMARWCRHHNLLTDDIQLTLTSAEGLWFYKNRWTCRTFASFARCRCCAMPWAWPVG